ncbi:MAG TPA: glycosyltransferase [Natronosporangium sp.]
MTEVRRPLLSVVVPVYRVERYLPTCLDSILADPTTAIEVLAVDDASPDRSGEIADEYAARDPRVRVVHLPANGGLGPARNAGLDRATGRYVWFVDSDDWLPAGSVAAVLERLRTSAPDVLIVDHALVFENGRTSPSMSGPTLSRLRAPVRLAEHPELLQLAQSACTKVVRRGLLDELKLRFAPGWYEDSAFSHPLLMGAERIEVLDRICYYYRQRNTGGITRTRSDRHFEVFEQYDRLFETVEQASPRYDGFKPQLFRLMIDHYLVIVGNHRRLPRRSRRRFFRLMASDYRTRLPAGGYEVPRGTAGLKHRLVRWDAYRVYAVLRLLHRAARLAFGWLRPGGGPGAGRRSGRRGGSVATAPSPAGQTPGQ